MTIGRVLAPGPATKLEITRSSSDRVKHSSQLEMIAGAMIGSVISRKASAGPAPRSMAASSSERSAAAKRDCTVMVTYAVQKVTCDSTMVVKPRCGQENSCIIDTNSSSCVMPVMISGMTSGAFTIPVSSSRPRKRAKRTSAIAARVPRTTAPLEAVTATSSDSSAACNSWRLCSSCPYQAVENPPQTLTSGEALNEYPISTRIGYSFNAPPLVNVWGGFSTAWYGQLLHNRQLLQAALLSLEVAVTASSGAVVLGTLAAIALVRFARFRGRLLLTGMVNAPLVMPEIITGITQLLLFVSMMQLFSWPHRGFTTIVLSHVTFCTAYVTITVQSRLAAADRSLEEAAMDLGAGPALAFLEITLPIIAPAIISSWLLCFTLSLDDLVISSFVAGPGASTLPMVIYSKVKLGVSPDINALASLIVCAVGVCIIGAGYLMTRTDRRRALEAQLAGR